MTLTCPCRCLSRTAPACVPSSQRFSSEIVQWQPWTLNRIVRLPLGRGLHDDVVWPLAQAVLAVTGMPVRYDLGVSRDLPAGNVLSNHGGRQLDGSRAPFDQLAEVVDYVGDRIDVLMDGGASAGGDEQLLLIRQPARRTLAQRRSCMLSELFGRKPG